MIKEFFFGLLGCVVMLAIIVVSERIDLKTICGTPVQISVDNVSKPVYPVGTFEYEVKRTQ